MTKSTVDYSNLVQNEHFVITQDEVDFESNATAEQKEQIKKDGFSLHFKMYDDDGEFYYGGYAKEEEFYPLDDFGMPNAGATEIKYRQVNGKYETL
jgi:hypothetical protein